MIRRVAFLITFAVTPLAAQTNGDSGRVAHAPFTDDQATRGEAVFQMFCASCHELTFHTGEQFRMNWFGRSVYDFFKVLKTTMPEDNIGGLTDDEYVRVIAYIFRLNGFPAGTDSLRSDSLEMKRLRIAPAPADSVKPFRR